jgi:hypothetical protein
MPPRSILQIVSGFKPSVDGMGDFARRLGTALWQRNNLRSHFVVYRTPSKPFDTGQIYPNTLSYSAEPSASAFIEEVDRLQSHEKFDCVLLHYGPYAYSRTGEPLEFVREIEDLAAETRLLVFFHELYASGMPWKRAFWTNPQQRDSVGRLLRYASVAFTSNAKYMKRLEGMNKAGRELLKIPIFSNIGEPEGLRPLHERSRQLVIFGTLVTRARLYQNHLQALEDVCRTLRIEKVVDVGSGLSPHIPKTLGGAEVRSTGWMDEDQLSTLMADSVAGVVGYWPDVWEKSGVVAAYQAHAMVPILVELESRNIPAPPYLPYVLAENISGLATRDGSASDAAMQQIADEAHAYYLRHQSVYSCADVIMKYTTGDARS